MSLTPEPRFETRELAGSPDLVDLVAAARAAGHGGTLVERPMPDATSVAGLGTAFTIVSDGRGAELLDGSGQPISGIAEGAPDQAAGRLWSSLTRGWRERAGARGLPTAGPLAIGGFAFHNRRPQGAAWAGFPAVMLRIPRLAVGRVRGRTFLTAADPQAFELIDLEPPSATQPRVSRAEPSPPLSRAEYELLIDRALHRLRSGSLAKVVIAREVPVHTDGVIETRTVLSTLRSAYPNCHTFFIEGFDGTAFLGATPELLVRRTGSEAVAHPMAGSIRRGRDETEDAALGAMLLASPKDRNEHQVVRDHVVAALTAVAASIDAPDTPELARFTNIQHLATRIRAQLADEPPPAALELAWRLHPTPAIAGAPPAEAMALIDAIEGFERGWYAGAVGWQDAGGDGEFMVGLRCGLLEGDGIRLFAGGGIMPDSDPAEEYDETTVKLRPLLNAIVRS